MIAGAFNLNDPIDEDHSKDVLRRTGAFIRRDPLLESAIFGNKAALDNLGSPTGNPLDTPFEIPKEYVDSATLCGFWLGLALYYGTHGYPCSQQHRVGVRMFTNHSIKEHIEQVEPLLQRMNRETPPPLDLSVPARFKIAHGVDAASRRTIFAAEIAGCAIWIIGIHESAFDESRMPWANWFGWQNSAWVGPSELLY